LSKFFKKLGENKLLRDLPDEAVECTRNHSNLRGPAHHENLARWQELSIFCAFGISISSSGNLEFVLMTILPAEGTLNAFVNLFEFDVTWQKQAAPYWRRDTFKAYFNLKNDCAWLNFQRQMFAPYEGNSLFRIARRTIT
jgi:hypothetical protein